jgi:2,4-diketo-3-deoxy-L-fuconate hydrolase
MKLMRVGPKGAEKPALLEKEGSLRDLSGVIADITGATLGEEGLRQLKALDTGKLPKIEGKPRIGVPISRIGKLVGVGVNYKDYIAFTGQPAPEEPIMFLKPDCTLAGANDDVKKPKTSQKMDWECELAIVIGKEGANIAESDALSHIAGWMLANDYTERWYQLDRGGTWDKGKSHDNFTPLGPWLVTRDEIPEGDGLKMWLEVNGKRFQDSNTANMIRKPAFLVSYLSEFVTFHPGDVIVTGSPAGVGALQKPPLFLNQGDVVELGIEGLGTQKQRIV